jgi:hypothetical protein
VPEVFNDRDEERRLYLPSKNNEITQAALHAAQNPPFRGAAEAAFAFTLLHSRALERASFLVEFRLHVLIEGAIQFVLGRRPSGVWETCKYPDHGA